MDDLYQEIGLKIRSLRQSHRLSQTNLADVLGITFQQLQKYEKGDNRISIEKLKLLANHFHVPMAHFLGEDEHDLRKLTPGEDGHDHQLYILLKSFFSIKNSAQCKKLLELIQTMSDDEAIS